MNTSNADAAPQRRDNERGAGVEDHGGTSTELPVAAVLDPPTENINPPRSTAIEPGKASAMAPSDRDTVSVYDSGSDYDSEYSDSDADSDSGAITLSHHLVLDATSESELEMFPTSRFLRQEPPPPPGTGDYLTVAPPPYAPPFPSPQPRYPPPTYYPAPQQYYPAPQPYYPAAQTYYSAAQSYHLVPVPGLDTGRLRRKKSNAKGSELPPLTNQPHELHTPRELVAAAEIEESCFETRIKQVEFGKWEAKGLVGMTRPCPACLVVLEVNFQPSAAGGAGLKNSEKCGKKRRWRKEKVVRFTEATLELEFEDASHDPPVSNPGRMTGPTILGFEPTLVTGAPSTGIQTTNFALQVGANPPAVDQLIPGLRVPLPTPCLNASFVTSSISPTTSAAAIHGTLRSHPPRRVVWAIQENEVEKSGVPRRMKVAIIVGYVRGRRFLMRAGMRATMFGSKDAGGLGTWIWGSSGAGKVQVVAGRDDEPVYFEDDYSRRVSSRANTVYCGNDKSNNGEMGAGQDAQVSEMKNLKGGMVSTQVAARATAAVGNAAGGMDMYQSSWRKWVPAATVNGPQALLETRRGSYTSFESSAMLVGEQGQEERKEKDDMNADRDLNGVDLKELTRMKGWSWNMGRRDRVCMVDGSGGGGEERKGVEIAKRRYGAGKYRLSGCKL